MQALISEIIRLKGNFQISTNTHLSSISEILKSKTEPTLLYDQQGHKILKTLLSSIETDSCASTAPHLNLNQKLNVEITEDISAVKFIFHIVIMLFIVYSESINTDIKLNKLRNVLKSLKQQNKLKSKKILKLCSQLYKMKHTTTSEMRF